MSAKPNPRLSEVLAPAFANCGEQEINDAMVWWGRLSGRESDSWQMPEKPVTIDAFDYDRLKTAAHGLSAVARLVQILADCGGESKPAPGISCGLHSALVALAVDIDAQLDKHEMLTSLKATQAGG